MYGYIYNYGLQLRVKVQVGFGTFGYIQSSCKQIQSIFDHSHVSGKNNKILPIPETMQGVSTSMEEKGKGRKEQNKRGIWFHFIQLTN